MIQVIDVKKEKISHFKVTKKGKFILFLDNYSGSLNVEIGKPETEVYIYGIYVGRNMQNFELKTIQHHRSKKTISDLLVKGVFFDRSKFIYEGLIRIEKQAFQSHAYQKNQNLILSGQAFIDSRPFLEILANDVFCTHGSTTGQPDPDQIYYLTSRGLSVQQAEKILVDGFINDIYNKIKRRKIYD